jgi:hypothetical protein
MLPLAVRLHAVETLALSIGKPLHLSEDPLAAAEAALRELGI